MVNLGSKEQDFISDLDPVVENDENTWTIRPDLLLLPIVVKFVPEITNLSVSSFFFLSS